MLRKSHVPILITWGIDPDTHTAFEPRRRTVDMALDLCRDVGIRSTFFVTARVDHISDRQLDRMLASGHEVGCHGRTHRDEEEYNRMPEAMQRDYVEKATRKLEQWVAGPIRSFRSPRVKTSARTLRLLGEYGYLADSSVCSQRIDFISSNLINLGWIHAPRVPYHPSQDSAFRRGDLSIWEVPISAIVTPFISATLRALGLAFMKALFYLLYVEARRDRKPIVYLVHPTEFLGSGKPHLTRWHLSPANIRTHGLTIRVLLYRMSGVDCLKATRELFAYMASFPDAEFMTVRQYVTSDLDNAPDAAIDDLLTK